MTIQPEEQLTTATDEVNEAEAWYLTKGLQDYSSPVGADLLERCAPMSDWVEASRSAGVLPFIRSHETAPDIRSSVIDFGGHAYEGLNLASQDYLGLARHPEVVEQSMMAVGQHGTHSAGSEPMGGGLADAKKLEAELGEFLGLPEVVLFPTGWGAGYGTIKALVRPDDFVVMDALSHDCLQQGARAATSNVVLFGHNDVSSLEKRLARVRRKAPDAAVLVVTESLFSMDSDTPDFSAMTVACREAGATLLVDVAHDLGVLGPGGRGAIAEQDALEGVDILVGSFSKTLASIGGFAALRSRAASYYVRGFSGTYTFSNFLIPAQVAAVRAALGIVRSERGDALRTDVLDRSASLRASLEREGLEVMGSVSPIVLANIGSEAVARLAQRRCFETGLIVNAVEFPACPRGRARFRLQVTPRHSEEMLDFAARTVAEAVRWAEGQVS